MRKINTIVFIILTLAGLWFGRAYYKKNMRKIIRVQRTQVANISKNLRTKDKESYKKAMVLLLIYGAIHSLGPGHGKSIISSVFLAENGSFKKVIVLGGIICYLQGFTAYFTVKIFNFLGKNLLPVTAQQTEDSVRYITAVFIMGIGSYLLYKKLRKEKSPYHGEKKSSFLMAFLLGITPCYGTINVLLFLSLAGMKDFQLAGTIAISTGMLITVGGTGVLAKTFKSGSKKIGSGCYQIMEYAGPIIMILYSLNFLLKRVTKLVM